jgi:hypothetical protein
MRGAVQSAWCREIFSEENLEDAEILLNRVGVLTVLMNGRLHKVNTNKKSTMEKEDEETRSKCKQVRSDENETGAEADLSAEGDL